VLALASLAVIGLLALAFKRVGLITPEPAPVFADPFTVAPEG